VQISLFRVPEFVVPSGSNSIPKYLIDSVIAGDEASVPDADGRFSLFLPVRFDRYAGGQSARSRLAQTRLVQLSLYLAVALSAGADALPIELKALDYQVVAIGLHVLLIGRGGSRGGRTGRACPLGGSE
jgi:hypothetical protein